MGNGHNHHLGWREPIHDVVGKSANQCATGVTVGRNRLSSCWAGSKSVRVAATASKKSPPRPVRRVSYQRTASASSSEAGSLDRTGRFTGRGSVVRSGASRSPRDPASLSRRQSRQRAVRSRQPTPLQRPYRPDHQGSPGVQRQPPRERRGEAQSVGKNGFGGLGHHANLTLGFAAQQALAAVRPHSTTSAMTRHVSASMMFLLGLAWTQPGGPATDPKALVRLESTWIRAHRILAFWRARIIRYDTSDTRLTVHGDAVFVLGTGHQDLTYEYWLSSRWLRFRSRSDFPRHIRGHSLRRRIRAGRREAERAEPRGRAPDDRDSGVLEEKTKGNLTAEERQILEQGVSHHSQTCVSSRTFNRGPRSPRRSGRCRPEPRAESRRVPAAATAERP